jgi:hypothetical protein
MRLTAMRYLFLLGVMSICQSVLAVSSVCLHDSAEIDQTPLVVGEAYSGDNKALIYCEYHYAPANSVKIIVDYRYPDGELIARKRLNYSSGLLSPDVLQEDFRTGELREVALLTDKESDTPLAVGYRKTLQSDMQTVNMAAPVSLVVDAGFNQAVRKYWNVLLGGETTKVNFVSPVHLRTIGLSITAKAISDNSIVDTSIATNNTEQCLGESYHTDKHVCFLIRPSSGLLSLFVEPLGLIYERASQRLLSYEGTVNINSEKGSSLKAIIRYVYDNNIISANEHAIALYSLSSR